MWALCFDFSHPPQNLWQTLWISAVWKIIHSCQGCKMAPVLLVQGLSPPLAYIHSNQPWNSGLSKGMSKRRYGTSLLSRSTSRMFVCYSLVDRNIDGQPGLSGFMLRVQTLYLAIASLAVMLVESYSHQQRCFWYDLRNIIFQSWKPRFLPVVGNLIYLWKTYC